MADGLSTADELAELAGMAEMQSRDQRTVRFYIEPRQNEKKSRETGKPVFEDVEIIEIHTPGDRDFVNHEVTPQDREQFPRQYLNFKRSQSQETANGFPLAQWAQIRRAQVEEARTVGVHTVEQLASVSDVNLQRFGPGWIQLRQHARDWVKNADSGAETAKLRNALTDALARISTLETMLAKQAQELHRSATSPVDVSYVAPPNDDVEKLKKMVADLAAQMVPPPVLTVTTPVNGQVPRKIDGRTKAGRAAKAAAQKT